MLSENEEIHFHTPAKFADAFPYLALVAGSRTARPEEAPIRKRFHQHVFVYTTGGCGLIEVRGQRFLAETGSVAWLDTAQAYAHSCAPDSESWPYLWMGIEGHGLDALYQFLGVQQSPLFVPRDLQTARAAFEAVSGYLAQRSPATDALASAAISGLIADMIGPRLTGREPGEDGRVVAVPDERLRVGADRVLVEKRQQVHAAIAAADRDEPGNRRIVPRALERRRADVGGPRQIAAPLEDRFLVDRLETQRAQLRDPLFELVAREGAGGRDDGEPVARTERAWLAH